MINVYSANETNFDNNGLATLNPLSADLSLEVNGNWVLTLVLPWDREKKYTYVEKNNIIIADVNCVREQASKRQKFRIYDYRKNYNTITVKACPVAFEATFDVPITNLSLVGENGKISGVEAVSRIQDYVDDVVADKYTITTDVTKTAKADYTNSNLIKAIASSDDNSFINTWGGEIAYDNYNIKINNALGDQDNASAYPIVYGKNITGVEYGIDVSNVVTRIYPISSDDMRLNAWDDLDATGKSTQQYVDGNTSAYPYIRSAFLVVDRAELIDTNSKSISDTRTHTLAWQDGIINKVKSVAKTLWQEVKKNEDQRFSPEYVQELIPDIVNYVQARYTFSHKGWQSFIKSCIKQGIEWIKDEEIAEWGWKGDYGAWWYGENSEIYAHDQYVLINKVYEYFNDEGFWQDWCRFEDADWYQTSDGTWWYGNKNDDGSTKNCAVSQYIYIYSEGKWYQFDGQGFYIDEEIPAETIALLNTYTWREDSTGWYYGDGNGNYLTNSWVESSEGRHYWVGADGYMDETKTDEQSWMWFTEPAKYRYGDYERYFAHNEYVYMTVEGQMKEWWYDKEGWYDDSKSGDSDFGWHGDGSASNPYWFGEEDAGTEDKNKYIHDKWAFIDGTYYWFDEYGYISGDASKAKQNYQWGVQTDTVTGDTWFGNPDRTYEAIYVKSQWLKIDGEWYYFGSDGYKVNMDEKKAEIIAWFGDEIYDETHEYIDDCLEEAYTYLYADMTAWANEQFTNGIDAPAVTVNVSLVDLSKTTEYKNYASFEQICLGDKVEVKALGMSFTERVVGLTYDVIRGYNTSVTIGKLGDTISSLMSTSFASVESGGTARLIGGDGVKVDGNVISSENVAVTYGIQDATLEGVSIVHGNVARLNDIYRELTQSQYNALSSQEKNSGKLFYITDTQTIMHKGVAYGGGSISYGTSTPTGGSDGDVYFQTDSNNNVVKIWQNHSGTWSGMTGGGLEYWTETSDQIKREFVLEGIAADDGYIFDDVTWTNYCPSHSYQGNFSFKKANSVPAICGAEFYIENKKFYLMSTSLDGVKWLYQERTVHSDWKTPVEGGTNTGTARKIEIASFVVDGVTWYISRGRWNWEGNDTQPIQPFIRFDTNTAMTMEQAFNRLYAQSHASPNTPCVAGIGKDDKILYHKVGENYMSYITEDGIYGGSDYKANGTSLLDLIDAKQNKIIAGQNVQIASDGKTISATDTTYSDFEGTDGATAGSSGLVPAPAITDVNKYLKGDGTWAEVQGGGGGGSNLILDAQKYSFDEQVVGIWTDGKPLYQKTWELSSVLSVASNTWVDTSILKQGIDAIIYINGANPEGAVFSFLGARAQTSTTNYVQIQQTRNSAITLKYITIQYTKTSDISGSGGYQAYGFSPIVCSDTEREVGVWEDNKPLYQKTFIGTLGGTAGSDVSNYKMADLSDIDTIASISGTLQGIMPINSYYASDNYNMVFVNGAKNGLYCNGKNIGGNTYKVTVQYTKASDTAGSGEYNTLAIPNVHYSTDEQVIGTWIDGKPIYQKTFTSVNIEITNANTWYDTGLSASGIANFIDGKMMDKYNYQFFPVCVAFGSSHTKIVVSCPMGNREIENLTIQYTKTTD